MRGVPIKTVILLLFLCACLCGWQLAEPTQQAKAGTIWQCSDGSCYAQPRPFLRPNYFLSVTPDSLETASATIPAPVVKGGLGETAEARVETAQPQEATTLAEALDLPPGAVIVSVTDSPSKTYRSVITRRRVLSRQQTYTCSHGNTHAYRTFYLPGRERRVERRMARRERQRGYYLTPKRPAVNGCSAGH